MTHILHFICRISAITQMRGYLESEETFTKISRKLLKKLPRRTKQNMPTKNEKNILIQSVQCVK